VSHQYLYQSPRIGVRGLSAKELGGNYLHWFSDASVCAFNSHFAYPKSQESLQQFIQQLSASVDHIVWAIYDRAEGVHVGNIGLRIFNRIDNNAELSFLLGEKTYWGRGYGFEAGQMMISHGFNVLNLQRIYCGCAGNNIPMQKLAAKLGFVQEGVRRKNLYLWGKYEDEIEYGLLREEFLARDLNP
jgi:RimJ/RimL family protein N-acetyltransferase